MTRRQKGLAVLGVITGTVLLLAAIAVFVLTRTDWGRERVRAFGVGQLAQQVAGKVTIDRLNGFLLTGATLVRVQIADSNGAPFLSADTIAIRYSLRSLFSKHLVFKDVRVVNPTIVLDQPPGGKWNFVRLFPQDTTARPDTLPGFGSWVKFEDVTIRNGTVVVRMAWEPADTLSPPARERAIEHALSPHSRPWIVAVPGGYQMFSFYRDVHAQLPLLRIADPDSAARVIEIASLRTSAFPFRPPGVSVRQLSGRFVLSSDSAWFDGLRVELPGTNAEVNGEFAFDSGDLSASVRATKLAFEDLRWLRPDLPDGGGEIAADIARERGTLSVRAQRIDLTGDGATLAGHAHVRFGHTLRIGDTNLAFANVDTRLIERLAPRIVVPVSGIAQGRFALNGDPSALQLDGWAEFRQRRGGMSRVVADGEIGTGDGVRARALRLRLEPLRIDLLRAFAADLPINGTIGGSATLNGSIGSRMSAALDLVVDTRNGRSHVIGDVAVVPARGPHFTADLRAPVLALASLGAFAPEAGLQGTARATMRASGTPDAFTFASNLALTNGGRLTANGSLSPGGGTLGYDVRAVLDQLDASVASTRAPETVLSGTLTVHGTGTDPATMNTTIAARLVDMRVDSATADSTSLEASIVGGMAHITRGQVSLASAHADLEGSFGLIEERTGELRYRVAIDSLAEFARWIPGDTTSVSPRPLLQARRFASARADSLRIHRETEVQRAATGQPLPPSLEIDSVRAIPADSVAGSIHTEGVIAGNIFGFAARGTLSARGLVAAGFAADSARAQYDVAGIGTPDVMVELDVAGQTLRTRGFAFDSATVRGSYAGVLKRGRGKAEIALFQDPERDYRLRSQFRLELDQRELTLDELVLRLDTVQWMAPHASEVRWARGDITVDSLELHSTTGGRIFVHGLVPSAGDMDLRVAIDDLPIAQVFALLQDTLQADGILDVDATARGSLAAPRFAGSSALVAASYGGRQLPDAHTTFDYVDTRLTANATLTRDARTLLHAVAELPLNLALSGVTGPRTLDLPLRIVARVDSLPLEALPSFTESVTDVRGMLRGELTVLGTFDDPVPNGSFNLDLASLNVVDAGVGLRDIAGDLRIQPDLITLDSLVANSAGGTIHARGTIGIATLTQPSFDLAVLADRARVLDNDKGRFRADADLAIAGALDALTVTGNVEIVEGVLYAPEAEQKRVTRLDDPAIAAAIDSADVARGVLPERNPLLENLRVDVNVRVARNTWVRNSDANVEIYTPDGAEPLHVRMLPDTGLVLEGAINADRGTYTFSGRSFELTTGSVTFFAGATLDPLLQLTARHEVPRRGREALAILIHIGGSLTEPQLTLESTAQPPLSQSDLLAYLAFGRSSSSLLDLDDSGVSGDALGGIGALAQQQLAGVAIGAVLDEAVTNIQRQGTRAGLDVFRIQPAELPEEFAFAGYFRNFLRGTEVIAGKYFTPRVYVAAQGRTTTETLPGFRVEYSASGGFSLEAVWEPRFLPTEPSLSTNQEATSARTFSTFLFWHRRF